MSLLIAIEGPKNNTGNPTEHSPLFKFFIIKMNKKEISKKKIKIIKNKGTE
jgi:hypothetical protein